MTTADDSVDIAPPISSGRIGLVLGLIALGMLGLVGRVVYLQTQFAAEMGERVEKQHRSVSGLAARRGSIFDRNGLMLAGTTLERDVFADPKFLHDEFAKTGRPLIELDMSLERVADRIAADPDKVALAVTGEPDKRYVPLAREMDADVAEAAVEYARSLDLRGIASQPSPRRSYPMARLASHVLGTVGRDGQGLEGIEAKHDDHLAGENGKVVTIRDKRRRAIQSFSDGVRPPAHGNGLVLTLDSRIQHIVERELAATVEAFQAEGASCVVLDPHTGDVLALANLPEYDPRFPGDFDVADRRNRAIVDPYEPGSVVKPFLMAAMLDTGVTSVDEVFVTGKTTRLDNGRRVTDDYGYEQLVGWDVVVKSSNIAMAKAVGRMTYDETREHLEGFGFGSKTKLGLGGEHGGLLYENPQDKYTQSSMAFGYAMLATPAQLARATAVFANGGYLVSPRLVAGTIDGDGTVTPTPRGLQGVALDPEAAMQMRRILADVFVRGTARHARSDRYNLFGKTGTAHQSEGGRQSETKYFASFIGGGPYESPRLVLCVTVDQPLKELGYHGGQVAGGTAARILEQSLAVLAVPPSPQLDEPPEAIHDDLHNYYGPRHYEPKRTLRNGPHLETTPALEAEEE